jgi:protein TonB
VVEKAETVFEIVEETAKPQGFYEYVRKNLKYPRQAKRMGVEGKVFLEFIVNKDGSIVDAKVLRGIGGGCDEEALRIIKSSPKWKPGKQRGQEVRQRMTFPLIFKLN